MLTGVLFLGLLKDYMSFKKKLHVQNVLLYFSEMTKGS